MPRLPSEAQLAEGAPEQFLARNPAPVLVDEVQYAPALFRHLKTAIDGNREQNGQYILAGSQKFSLMREVADSLAGRCGVTRLNYLAAMIEQTAASLAVAAPEWTRLVPPLKHPVFASELGSLRLHLLMNALPPFRRRNLFVDTSIGGRV